MKVILTIAGGSLCLWQLSTGASIMCRQDEFRAIRKDCTRCIAEADECLQRQYYTAYYALHSHELAETRERLIQQLIENEQFVRACLVVDKYRLKKELEKPFFKRDNAYCWLLDAQMYFYEGIRTLTRAYIEQVYAHLDEPAPSYRGRWLSCFQ